VKRLFQMVVIALLAGAGMLASFFHVENTSAQEKAFVGVHTLDLEAFRRIPVLNNGRKMPMDSYARQKLLQFSGRTRLEDDTAVSWFTRVLFAPETVRNIPVFLIEHPEAAQALGLEAVNRARYSIAQLEPSLNTLEEIARTTYEMSEDDHTGVEKELMRLYINLTEYFEHTHSFSFAQIGEPFLVENDELRSLLQLPADQTAFSFLDIHQHGAGLRPLMQEVADKPQEDWTPVEREAVGLSMALYEWAHFYEDLNFSMIPLMEDGQERWIPGWEAIRYHMRNPDLGNGVMVLHTMAQAFQQGDQVVFDDACNAFSSFVAKQIPGDRDLKWVPLEVTLNKLNPFMWAKVLYTLAFLVALAAIIARTDLVQPGRFSSIMRWSAVALCLAALLPHSTGIVMRMLIMGRPPATNLYATFLFVAWVAVLLGLLVESRQRLALGVLAASFCGICLLLVANYFAYDGDTMGKVVAVLSSNFWLSVHVLTIAMGYAGCVLAGIIGQVYLVAGCVIPKNKALFEALKRAIYATLGFGLTFTYLGTMLGGVWADQSWGRFWGWDPKENGALLIVLWCAVLFHAKIAHMIGDVGLAVGCALGIIIVMFAWLGVNLLGVGLHSYGFTSGLAWGLLLYIAIQLATLLIIAPVAHRRLQSK